MDPARVNAIVSGTWEGLGQNVYIEDGAQDADAFGLRIEFRKPKGKKLTADFKLLPPPSDLSAMAPEAVDELVMTGGFFDSWYLQFTYENKYPQRKQMGVAILRLNAHCDRMSGHYAGFSPYREKFVMGEIELYRPGQRPEKIQTARG